MISDNRYTLTISIDVTARRLVVFRITLHNISSFESIAITDSMLVFGIILINSFRAQTIT